MRITTVASSILAAFMGVNPSISSMIPIRKAKLRPRHSTKMMEQDNGDPMPSGYPGAKLARKALRGQCGIRFC